ncbi:MAG TPA: HAMP domain-containing sensor histidine kinase, partial [Candidatus Saccharimonadales bacterium]|nr:HAMP domain-containing sensor histidine kinase [Candidatus Saccharimonadales bacterium]
AEPGGRPVIRSEVTVDDIVASCRRRVEPVARANGVTITTALSDATVPVDRVRMEQALANLVMNAVTHARAGGSVDVIAAVDEHDPAGRRLLIDVLDRGPGIPPQARQRIFEPFERAGATGGVGLGLATAAAAVRAHGGAIGVEPRSGGGSRFWLWVPLQPARAPEPARVGPGHGVDQSEVGRP